MRPVGGLTSVGDGSTGHVFEYLQLLSGVHFTTAVQCVLHGNNQNKHVKPVQQTDLKEEGPTREHSLRLADG